MTAALRRLALRALFFAVLGGAPAAHAENPALMINEPPGPANYLDVATWSRAPQAIRRPEDFTLFGMYDASLREEYSLGGGLTIFLHGKNQVYCRSVQAGCYITIAIGLNPSNRLDALSYPDGTPSGSLQLDLPGIGWSGPAQVFKSSDAYMTHEKIHFQGPVQGGIWLGAELHVFTSGDSGDVSYLAPSQPNREEIENRMTAGRRAAAAPYLQEMRAKALAQLQTLRINPKSYLKTEAKQATPAAAAKPLEVTTAPRGKASLLADGKDGVTVRARAVPKAGESVESAARKTASITFTASGPAKDWVDFGVPTTDGGWRQVYLQASNPDKVRGPAKPPASVEIRATLKDGKQELSQTITLQIAANAEIDAKPDVVEFALGSGQSAEVKVAIENPGPDKWKFRAEYDKASRPVASATLKATDGSHALVTLREAGLEALHDGSNTEVATLRILAEQEGRDPLERDIKVAVAQEGLFVSPTGRDAQTRRFNVAADGKAQPKDVDFRIYVQDPETKRIDNLTKNPETLKAVTVECLEEPSSPAGRLIAAGQMSWKLAGIRSSNQPAGILRLAFAKELPSDGRTVPCDFRITYTTGKDDSYSSIITVGIVTTANGPGGRDWQVELEKCQTIIRKFVPAAYQPRMREMLDRRKMTLGPEGLHALRERIWMAAAELTLGEGGQGYADEARWANYITESLEWTQWAGDLAFNAAIGTVTGPYGALGAGTLKGMVISALNAYQDGQTAEEWLWGNLCTIPGILEGKIIDPDTFEQLGMQNKAKVWAVFVSYHFLKNLYNGQTVVEALKSTAREVGNNVLGSWLGAEVKKNGQRSAGGWVKDKAKGAADAVGSVARGAKSGADDAPTAKAVPPAGKKAAAKDAPAKQTASAKPGSKVSPTAKGTGADDVTPTKPAATKPSPDTVANTTKAKPASPGSTAPVAANPIEGPGSKPADSNAAKPKATDQPGAETKTASQEPKPADDGATPPAEGPSAPVMSDAARLVQGRMQRAGNGEYYAHPDDVLAIMRDPSMVRALKKAPPELQQAFSNTRESIYRQHDNAVVEFVRQNVKGMKYRMVKVLEFRTPGADGANLNTDRDYRVCYYAGRNPDNGQEMWIEVPRRDWEDFSYGTFAQLTGKPDGTPKENREWAEMHQQLATDRYHPEASPAFTDQKSVWNPKTGKVEKMQVTSNFTRVSKNRQEGLDVADPHALGQMYVVKVADARFKHEAFVQANKAVKALIELRKSYNVQGRAIGVVPEKMMAGMVAVSNACAKLAADPNCRDPVAIAKAERILHENGFSGLNDFMQKMSGQFEALKFMSAK